MSILRKIQNSIEMLLFPGGEKQRAIVIYGARQVGKTTLVKSIQQKYAEGAVYYNCDYLDVRDRFAYESIQTIGSLLKGVKLLILDEAQRIENIGLILKILVDDYPQVQVLATGSSSFELSNSISESLTGRKHTFYLYPFSFAELEGEHDVLTQRRNIEQYLRFGCYPEVVGRSDSASEVFLKELVANYLFKDVFTFQHLRKPELLVRLLRLLAFQVGSEVSYSELAVQLGVDQTVVQHYLHLLEEAFVVFRLGAFKRNLRAEVTKSRKVFFWDLGVRNAVIGNYNPLHMRDDVGVLWENYFIAERMKHNHYRGVQCSTYFWRTYQQQEVDYLEETGGQIQAFECKWKQKKKFVFPKQFSQAYPGAVSCVATPDAVGDWLL